MKKQQYFTFLSQLLAGLKSEKNFFIAKNTKAANQLSAVFIQLGIIEYVTKPNELMFSKNFKKNKFNNVENKSSYLVFWFKKIYKTNDNEFYLNKNKYVKHSYSFHKIKIMNKNNSYHKNKISYTDLNKAHSYWNIIYIISTPKGLLTSKEAYESKTGGFILCKIIL